MAYTSPEKQAVEEKQMKLNTLFTLYDKFGFELSLSEKARIRATMYDLILVDIETDANGSDRVVGA